MESRGRVPTLLYHLHIRFGVGDGASGEERTVKGWIQMPITAAGMQPTVPMVGAALACNIATPIASTIWTPIFGHKRKTPVFHYPVKKVCPKTRATIFIK